MTNVKSYSEKLYHRNLRFGGYDYAQDGAYFVTIVTQNRSTRFGNAANGEMVLNDAGRMIHTAWNELPRYYAGVNIDEFVVMPNHIHGIIVLVAAGLRACLDPETPDSKRLTHDFPANLTAPGTSVPRNEEGPG